MMTFDGGHGYVECSEQKCCNVVVWYGNLALGSIPTRRSSDSPVCGAVLQYTVGDRSHDSTM